MTAATPTAPRRPRIVLTDEQEEVAQRVARWYALARTGRPNLPDCTIGGLAGVGKTTVAGVLPSRLNVKPWQVAYCAFTGKAASRIRDANGQQVGKTIHRLIYSPVERHCEKCPKRKDANEPCHRARPEDLAARLCVECDLTPKWRKTEGLGKYALVIVDEASMVNEWIYRDLKSFGVPIVWIGDHGQLPPVKGSFNLMANPVMRLETIHRQLAGSPILRLAMQARQDGYVPFGLFGPGVQKRRLDGRWSQALKAELILCGRNDTRVAVNEAVRQLRELPPDRPVPEDRVICLRNDYDAKVFNGTQGTVLDVDDAVDCWALTVRCDDDVVVEVEALKEQFGRRDTVKDAGRGTALWDYGYALTVHKAQGSEADDVLLLEQPIGDPRRWLYTGITRAKRSLEIISRG